jgi:hypothetical protein
LVGRRRPSAVRAFQSRRLAALRQERRLSELAKVAVGAAGNFTMVFDPRGVPDLETKLHFMEAQSAWFEKFFGRPLDVGQIGKMRELLERAKAARQ